MIYHLQLYIANPSRERFFVDCMRAGGLYQELARRTLPGFMAQDLLRNQQDASEFLCLSFWASGEAYSAAHGSPNAAVLARLLSKLTVFSADLGVYFTLPARLAPPFPGAELTVQGEEQNPGGAVDDGLPI